MDVVRRFLRWWASELAALLPASLRVRSRQRGDALQFAVQREAVEVNHVRDGKAKALGEFSVAATDETAEAPVVPEHVGLQINSFRAETTRCEVHVAAELALVKQISLPLAASENLRQVLAFEMERQTPFRAEEVYYDYVVLERNLREQLVKLRIGVVPRRIVDNALLAVKEWDLLQQVDTPGRASVDETGVGFTFLSSRYRTRLTARLTPVLAAANVLLLAAAVLVPLHQQRSVMLELESTLETTKREANDTLAVQERIAQLRAEAEFLTQRSFGHLPLVELLEELSALLPDSTWLFRLEVKNGSVQLQGTSLAASSLIATLEQSEHLANVRFASPVLREASSGRERFHLSADITERAAGDGGETTARRTKRKSG